jgi:type II restriction/modification system DNA methylase subunit YeeA
MVGAEPKTVTPQQFIAKWQRASLSERSACQQHFLDLCELLGEPKPAEADPDGTWYTFEKGVQTTEGGKGWADVWMRDHFGWEYKGKHKDLKAGYSQLLLYREALENPPLLVVCDMDRFEVHTNFTGTAKKVHVFDLAGLADGANLDILRRVFTDPASLKPGITSEAMTVEAAERFAKLADGMRQKGVEPLRAAHFLMKLMFCMFGQHTGLLPAGLFGRLLETGKANSTMMPKLLQTLFEAMANGGVYGSEIILWFNGGLFADADGLPLTTQEINTLANINKYDWASVEPSIFGTLFERTLDPAKRSQIGAHYTSRADIETLLKPVLLAPLAREWAGVKRKCEEELWPKVVKASKASRVGRAPASPTKTASPARKAFDRALLDFVERLAHVRVLDPACGSGNFLYVAIHMLLDLEKEVITYASDRGLAPIPQVNPTQLHGLEINPYAQQLAQVVVWIGYLQWMHYNGFKMPDHPVLTPIETIRRMDAILDLSDPEHPKEPEWPEAEFIVGNPPFLGGKLLRKNLGDEYVDAMFKLWGDRVPREADLCCYWFERARELIKLGKCRRAGLLATQGIRGGANRKVLERIKESGDIFFAVSDREWVLDGAMVHISMAGFDRGEETDRMLDGAAVSRIHANLRATTDTTKAKPIAANLAISFMGDTKGGAFDIGDTEALAMLCKPNPHGRPNSDVLVPWVNGMDVTGRPRGMWIIDFGAAMSIETAARYESPFAHVDCHVRPEREKNKRQAYRERWWIHVEARPALRQAISRLERLVVTVRVSKYRIFSWFCAPILPDSATFAFARSDDFFFGLLHSRIHEVWARAQGTQLREVESGFRYTPSSCFETFPFPERRPNSRRRFPRQRRNWTTFGRGG